MLKRPPRTPPSKRPDASSAVPTETVTRGLIPFFARDSGLSAPDIEIRTYTRYSMGARLRSLEAFVGNSSPLVPLSRHPAWLTILDSALAHEPYAIEATAAGRTVGFLPLAFLDSYLFGKFLVSLPYLNTNGALAVNSFVQKELISRAVTLADELGARHLELRHESAVDHPGLTSAIESKVHLRLALPDRASRLWDGFDPKVRNQIRKGEKHDFQVIWGGMNLLAPFYDVLSRNMRALGSPLYGIALFREVLAAFPASAEVCLVRAGEQPIAAALLLHGQGVTEVPTASALKEFNSTSVNMLMYWRLLQRAIERGQQVFDFGRSTVHGNTYKFKKQWGAIAEPAVWQYRINCGEAADMRPDHPRYRLAIRLWQRLPLAVTRSLGPLIVRGIP